MVNDNYFEEITCEEFYNEDLYADAYETDDDDDEEDDKGCWYFSD